MTTRERLYVARHAATAALLALAWNLPLMVAVSRWARGVDPGRRVGT